MAIVRRLYILLVSAISLNVVAWATIGLLRHLLTLATSTPVSTTAFQVAVIVIGLPIFIVHWLWAQRLSARDPGERESALRRLYLYGMLAGFLGPFVVNTYDLVAILLGAALGSSRTGISVVEGSLSAAAAMIVLALLGLYHRRVVAFAEDTGSVSGHVATIRRLFVIGFCAAGVTLTALATVDLLHWTMLQFGHGAAIDGLGTAGLTDAVARLAVGVPLWLVFWVGAQRLFQGAAVEERESALRKLYLYIVVFVAVLSAVTNGTFILAGLLRSLLGLAPTGDVRGPLSVVIGMLGLWAYHAHVLRGDAARVVEVPAQAGIRRLYLYLVAAIGLAALLVGLGGDISVLIRSLSQAELSAALREQLAWFTAALFAGLAVWLMPWRRAQSGAVLATPVGAEERRSVVRKIYLYFYLFVATMTVLAGAVYIVYRLLSLALGETGGGDVLSDLGQAIAYSLIGAGIWIYHGWAVRGDGQRGVREQRERQSALNVTVLDVVGGHFGRAVLDALRREMPGIILHPIELSLEGAAAVDADSARAGVQPDLARRLAAADVIVGPWEMAVAGGAQGRVSAEIAAACAASPALKLLVPLRVMGWEWIGVGEREDAALVGQTVHAVKQVSEGERVTPARPLGAGTVVGMIAGGLVLLILIGIPVLLFFSMNG